MHLLEKNSKFNLKINPSKSSIDFIHFQQQATNFQKKIEDSQPDPQGAFKFDQEDFIKVYVQQDGKQIKLHTYLEKSIIQPPKALLIINHGLGSHGNRFAHIAKAFSKEGVEVIAIDFRGYGKSEGIRGLIDDFQDTIQDDQELIKQIDQIYDKKLPKFHLGQSLGGLVGFHMGLIMKSYFQGIIMLAPALKDNASNRYIGKKILQFLSYIIPRTEIIKSNQESATKNIQCNYGIQNDPYTYKGFKQLNLQFTHQFKGGIRPITITNLITAMNDSQFHYDKFNNSFIIVQGALDQLVDITGAFDLFEKSSSNDKTLLFYENALHDLAHEIEINEYLPTLIEWVLQRSQITK